MNPLSFLAPMTFIRLRLIFEAFEPVVLPEYKGSAFRGCLGETLRNEVCSRPGLPCERCRDRFDCPFSQLFNSFVPKEHPHHRKYPKSPHPYIIDPMSGNQTQFEAGETFGFDLTLIGSAIELLPMLLRVFYRMGDTGIGKGRGQFKSVGRQALRSRMEYEQLPYFRQPDRLSIGKLPIPVVDNHIGLNLEIRFD